ncbi:MAG TPA: hypothetical protein VEJ40_08705 [Pseudolabrys sp.]|nr:hypothetical protein [Pseudolabrys sp.]
MRTDALCGGAVVALVWSLATVPALAQDVRVTAPAPSMPGDESQVKPLTPEEGELLGRALLFDPATLKSSKPARGLRARDMLQAPGLDIKSDDNPDGSSSVALKRPVIINAPDIDSNVGADVNLAAPAPSVYQPNRPLPNMTTSNRGSAAAWASVGMNNLASVDARLDQGNDQGKIGGTFKRSVPVGQDLSISVEDSYSMIENFNPAAPITTAPTTTTLAGPAPVTTTPTPRVFDNSRAVKFNVLPTGTTFGAGWSSASNDPVTHNTLSADQKLYGPLHVTTSVTDPGQTTENKTITAGFELNW